MRGFLFFLILAIIAQLVYEEKFLTLGLILIAAMFGLGALLT